MKLVDILARELKEWPVGRKCITQDVGGNTYSWAGLGCEIGDCGCWYSPSKRDLDMRFLSDKFENSEDQKTAIVTREQWESARAKLSKPKGNADGWIRHRGGKCPVEKGTLIDVRHRDGEKAFGVLALKSVYAATANWAHDAAFKARGEIMAWRIHKPEEPLVTTEEKQAISEVAGDDLVSVAAERVSESESFIAKPEEGPITWRDRIAELDAKRKEIDALYASQSADIESERADLVGKLAAEGFALIERKADPFEDMSDWRNWKAGDYVECTCQCYGEFSKGVIYVLREEVSGGTVRVVMDDSGKKNGWLANNFKWHSRLSE